MTTEPVVSPRFGSTWAEAKETLDIREAVGNAVDELARGLEYCECERKLEDCATFEDEEADHGDRI